MAALAAVVALAAVSPGSGARLANSQTYTDPRADAAAPAIDLTRIVVSNDDAGTVRFRITLDRPALAETDSVDLYLDTDRNGATGERGSDIRISAQTGSVRLLRPIGAEWFPIAATTLKSSVAAGVLTVSAARRELERFPAFRNPGFNLYATTSAGTATGDVAPEAARTGTTRYSYAIKIADKVAPTLKALPSAGKRGTIVKLQYMVTDTSGKTQEQVTVYRGTAVVARVKSKLGPSQVGVTYHVRWSASATLKPGTLRFCVRSTDVAGNRSKQSCASLRLT